MTDPTIFDRFRRRVDAFFLAIFLLSAGLFLTAPTPDVSASHRYESTVGFRLTLEAILEFPAIVGGALGFFLMTFGGCFHGLPEDRLRRLRAACALAFPAAAASVLAPAIFARMGLDSKSITVSGACRQASMSFFVVLTWCEAQKLNAGIAAAAPGIFGGGRFSKAKAESAASFAWTMARSPRGLLAWSVLCLIVRRRIGDLVPVANEASIEGMIRHQGTASWILFPIAALSAIAGLFGRTTKVFFRGACFFAAFMGIYCGGVAGGNPAFAWPPDLMQSPFVPLGLHLAIALITGPRFADRIVAPPAELNPA